jgi:haloalkane dehalogenase
MHVMEVGSGIPVVMVHGNPTWGYLYRNIANRISQENCRALMPDLIGFGFSDKPVLSQVHQLSAHARWLGRFLSALGTKRVVLVVHDWGGPVGVSALKESGIESAGLVILNTVLGPPKPGFKPTPFHRFAQVPLLSTLSFRLLGFPQRMMPLVQGQQRSLSKISGKAYRYPLRLFWRNGAPLAMTRRVPSGPSHPSNIFLQACEDYIRAFKGPTAVVWGDRDPILGSVRNRIATLLPGAEITRVPGGHFLQEEFPGEIGDAILSVVGKMGLESPPDSQSTHPVDEST